MENSRIEREIEALKLAQFEGMVGTVNTNNGNKYWNTPFTFLIITNASKWEFEVFQSPVPAIKGNIQDLVELAYISHPGMQPKYRNYWVFVIGKWNKTRWEVVSGKGELSHDVEYLVIMTRVKCYAYLINGAIYAWQCDSYFWQISVLATSVFATEFLYDKQWKRVDNEPCTFSEVDEFSLGKVICKSKKTYLEVFFEAKQNVYNHIVRFLTDDSGHLIQLNDICTGAKFLNFNMSLYIWHHTAKEVPLKIGEDISQARLYEFNLYFNTGRSLFQIVNGLNLDCNKISWPNGGAFVSQRFEKEEGETAHHFIYGTDSDHKMTTLHANKDSSLLDLIQQLSEKFEIAISKIGSCYVHLYEGEFIVTKYLRDVHKLTEFGAYLFE